MPELPEVESIRRILKPQLQNAAIVKARFFDPRALPHSSPAAAEAFVAGQKIMDLQRRGKYLIALFPDQHWMVIHLRMTGRLFVLSPQDQEAGREIKLSARLLLDNGGQLCFQDVRRFGTIDLGRGEQFEPVAGLVRLGPDPSDPAWNYQSWAYQIKQRRAPIKSLLLNQCLLAGLGNIYADESLFRAGIHPSTPGCRLSRRRLYALAAQIQAVLAEALDHQGTTFRDFRTDYNQEGSFQYQLRVYQRRGKSCMVCGHAIEKLVIAGRSSHYCPQCQS